MTSKLIKNYGFLEATPTAKATMNHKRKECKIKSTSRKLSTCQLRLRGGMQCPHYGPIFPYPSVPAFMYGAPNCAYSAPTTCCSCRPANCGPTPVVLVTLPPPESAKQAKWTPSATALTPPATTPTPPAITLTPPATAPTQYSSFYPQQQTPPVAQQLGDIIAGPAVASTPYQKFPGYEEAASFAEYKPVAPPVVTIAPPIQVQPEPSKIPKGVTFLTPTSSTPTLQPQSTLSLDKMGVKVTVTPSGPRERRQLSDETAANLFGEPRMPTGMTSLPPNFPYSTKGMRAPSPQPVSLPRPPGFPPIKPGSIPAGTRRRSEGMKPIVPLRPISAPAQSTSQGRRSPRPPSPQSPSFKSLVESRQGSTASDGGGPVQGSLRPSLAPGQSTSPGRRSPRPPSPQGPSFKSLVESRQGSTAPDGGGPVQGSLRPTSAPGQSTSPGRSSPRPPSPQGPFFKSLVGSRQGSTAPDGGGPVQGPLRPSSAPGQSTSPGRRSPRAPSPRDRSFKSLGGSVQGSTTPDAGVDGGGPAQGPQSPDLSRRPDQQPIRIFGKRSTVSESPFGQPSLHSSGISEGAKLGEEGSSFTFDSTAEASQLLKLYPDFENPDFNYDRLNAKGRKMYELWFRLKENTRDILQLARTANAIKERIRQRGETPELVLQYVRIKHQILERVKEGQNIKQEVNEPGKEPVDVNINVEILPELDTSTTKVFMKLTEDVPDMRKLVTSPKLAGARFLPAADELFNPNITEELAERGLADTSTTRKVFEREKANYAKLKRSLDRALDIREEIPNILEEMANKPDRNDEEEREVLQNLLGSFFQHRRNAVNHYLAATHEVGPEPERLPPPEPTSQS